MRKCKCKSCGKEIFNTEAYQVIEGKKKSFYCTKEEYEEILLEKQQYNSCTEVVAKITKAKFITPVMLKKLKEIRQFYDYPTIERTFKENQQSIEWSMENRDFTNEFAKAKYITSIIANNIAKVERKINKEKKDMERLFTKENSEIEVEIMDTSIERETENPTATDISMFLD